MEPVELVVEDGIPGAAEVGRLPDSAVVGRHVEDIWMAGNAGDGDGAASAEGADHAPAQFLKHGGINLRFERRRKHYRSDQYEERENGTQLRQRFNFQRDTPTKK